MNNKEERLYSLDLLRGLDMMFLTVVGPLLIAINAIWKVPQGLMYFSLTHPWEGFTGYDIIMPMFIFMCGAAIPFALERRIAKSGGHPNAAFWKHVIGRFALLWVLGLIVQGRLLTFNLDKIRIYDNTLETIAFGYLICAITIALTKRMWVKIAVPVTCFILYGVLLHAFGDYSHTGNFAFKVEKAILTAIVPATSETMAELQWTADQIAQKAPYGIEVHYTWYLTSLMFVFMAFCGYFATKILTAAAPQWTKARRLFAYGAGLLALGWLLTFCGVRMVKHIFTVSFTAQAMGWSALFLAALYVITDIWKFRRGLGVVILFGQFALWAYMIEECFKAPVSSFAHMVLDGVPNLIGTAKYQPLIIALGVIAVIIAVLSIRRKLKTRN